jgi:hypothetical protein
VTATGRGLAGAWDVPVQRAQQTSGGVPVACGEVDAKQGLELVDPDARADLRGAVAVGPDEGFLDVVLVDDLPDESSIRSSRVTSPAIAP